MDGIVQEGRIQIVKSLYPTIPVRAKLEELALWCQEIVRLRQVEDLSDFTNLNQVFVSGRSVQKIPTGSADVAVTDVIGDISYALDGSYCYILVNATGTPAWRRVALASW